MMWRVHVVLVVLASIALICPRSTEGGQAAIGAAVAATTSLDSKTELSVVATTGYLFSRHFGLGIEVMSVPVLKPHANALTVVSNPLRAAVTGTDGRAIVFTSNVRIELWPMARVFPYVIAGGGVANVKETFAIRAAPPSGLPVDMPPVSATQSSTELVLAAGGGVDVLLTSHISLDLDLRYLRLSADRDHDVGRFGAGISYRF